MIRVWKFFHHLVVKLLEVKTFLFLGSCRQRHGSLLAAIVFRLVLEKLGWTKYIRPLPSHLIARSSSQEELTPSLLHPRRAYTTERG